MMKLFLVDPLTFYCEDTLHLMASVRTCVQLQCTASVAAVCSMCSGEYFPNFALLPYAGLLPIHYIILHCILPLDQRWGTSARMKSFLVDPLTCIVKTRFI